ncbi:MAG: IPT/TIG domain-containing protein, partial [Bryobacteraceae bacterium]
MSGLAHLQQVFFLNKIAKERILAVHIRRLLRVLSAASIMLTAASAQTGTLKVYLSPPAAQSSTVSGVATETFDALTTGIKTAAYVSTAGIGTYTGSATNPFAIMAPDVYGGATDSTHTSSTNYLGVGGDSKSANPVILKLAKPAAYFGFWWSAGDANNRVSLYSGSTLYGTFSTADLLSFLKNGSGTITATNGTAYQTSAYFGNPNIASGSRDATEPFAYVSFAISDATIDTLEFYNTSATGSSFESDNHSVISSGSTVTIPTTFVPVETLTLATQVQPPTFAPPAGNYTAAQTVTISSTTPGALITYTTNGTTPSASGGTASPVTVQVNATETINAIAYESGMTSSAVVPAAYTITPAPSITSLSPTSGPVSTSVTITGTNFGASQGASTVAFNGTAAGTATSWSATSIVVKVPTGATTGNVVVTVGGLASNGVSFTVTVAPSITSLSPTSGPVGTSVTITGTNFGASQGTSTVTFNGTSAGTATSWSATSIVVKVPTGATTGNVVVTVGGLASNGVSFTVTV